MVESEKEVEDGDDDDEVGEDEFVLNTLEAGSGSLMKSTDTSWRKSRIIW